MKTQVLAAAVLASAFLIPEAHASSCDEIRVDPSLISEYTIEHGTMPDGTTPYLRTICVVEPPDLDPRERLPLYIEVHGNGGTPSAAITRTDAVSLCDGRNGYRCIVAAPAACKAPPARPEQICVGGVGSGWERLPGIQALGDDRDDLGLLYKVAATAPNADWTRTFINGTSGGGRVAINGICASGWQLPVQAVSVVSSNNAHPDNLCEFGSAPPAKFAAIVGLQDDVIPFDKANFDAIAAEFGYADAYPVFKIRDDVNGSVTLVWAYGEDMTIYVRPLDDHNLAVPDGREAATGMIKEIMDQLWLQ